MYTGATAVGPHGVSSCAILMRPSVRSVRGRTSLPEFFYICFAGRPKENSSRSANRAVNRPCPAFDHASRAAGQDLGGPHTWSAGRSDPFLRVAIPVALAPAVPDQPPPHRAPARAGRLDAAGNRQAQPVDQDVPLAALHPLAPTEATDADAGSPVTTRPLAKATGQGRRIVGFVRRHGTLAVS
jgi:hypothetical protein